jgi:hypothetical protein
MKPTATWLNKASSCFMRRTAAANTGDKKVRIADKGQTFSFSEE